MLRYAVLLAVLLLRVTPIGAADAPLACPAFPATIANGDVAGLIEAIACANATPADEVITLAENGVYLFTAVDNTSPTPLPAPYNVLTVGANALPPIADASTSGTLTIQGGNATLERDSSAPNMRFFYIAPGGDLTLSAITLLNGRSESVAGALFNSGTLHGDGVIVNGNQAVAIAPFFISAGGGLLNLGSANLTNSSFISNISDGQGGAIANGLSNAAGGALTVRRSIFFSNQSNQGGAIHSTSTSTAQVEQTHLHLNSTVGGSGGVIFVSGTGSLTLADSLVENNLTNSSVGTPVRGGALFISSGTLTVVNSTLTSNTSFGQSGGALHVQGGTVTLRHSTIFGNSASARGGGIGSTLANMYSISLENTLIADNSAVSQPDVDARITSQGYNLITNSDGAVISGGMGDLLDAAASPHNLGALADNGGPTFTHLPLPGSVAIDAGDPAQLITDDPIWDQRGESFARVQGRRLDIGAVETTGGFLAVTLTMQAHGTPPNAAHVITAHVALRPEGGGAAILEEDHVSDTDGVITIGDLPPGSWTLWVKGTHTLAVAQSVTLSQGGNSVTTAVLREGDVNDDNRITVADFSILAAAFGRASGTPGFDPRGRPGADCPARGPARGGGCLGKMSRI